MTDGAPQVEVTAIEAPPSSGDVLAAAAVESAAVSGVAAATAVHADQDAAAAQATADAAAAQAAQAQAAAAQGVTEARVKQLVDEGMSEGMAQLATVLQPPPPAVEATATVEAAPVRDTPPANLAAKEKRKTLAQRYAGG
jgi:sorbitol-specific phosphotransferase system component IIBC